MTSVSIASTRTVSSTSQYSAETLLAILERPSTSLSQSVDVVMETPDLEVILPMIRRLPLGLLSLLSICVTTLPMHSTPLEPSSQETPARVGTQYISLVSGYSLLPQLPFHHTQLPEIYISYKSSVCTVSVHWSWRLIRLLSCVVLVFKVLSWPQSWSWDLCLGLGLEGYCLGLGLIVFGPITGQWD